MKREHKRATLKAYLDLNQLLSVYRGSHEENRVFALEHKKKKSFELLLLWLNKNIFRVTDELFSQQYLHYFTLFSTVFSLLMLILGFSTGFALLSYSGAEPVNVIYLLLVMVGLPLLSMSLTLLSMVTGGIGANFFAHLSPLYYLEKLLNFLPFSKKIDFSELPFSSTLTKWLFLQRVQLFSFLFSLGLFSSLILMIISKDIAFGWSSTLQVDVASFQTLLATLGFPWQSFVPSAIPSVELVEVSHYFRLGEHLDAALIANADKLGAWWKFLAMATLTYALLLRLLFWWITTVLLNKQIKKEMLLLDGVKQLFVEFETPYVSTQAFRDEHHLDMTAHKTRVSESKLVENYHALLVWNFSKEDLLMIEDHFHVYAECEYVVGGRNSFSEDQKVIVELEKNILLCVKAWEPPTMDFMDFVEEILLKKEVLKVDVLPLGTTSNGFKSQTKDLEMWISKLSNFESKKLGVIDV
jgi:hypothetical protein